MKKANLLLMICILSFGCERTNDSKFNSNKSPTAPTPAATDQKPAPTEPSQPTPPTYGSGGLGLSRSDWERQHGSPTRKVGFIVDYEGGRYAVTFADDNISHLEQTWGDRDAVTLDVARSQAKSLIPADSKLIRTYTPRESRLGDLYYSESLKARFKPLAMPSGRTESRWIGGKLGDFLILYRINNNRVTSLVIAIGNNP